MHLLVIQASQLCSSSTSHFAHICSTCPPPPTLSFLQSKPCCMPCLCVLANICNILITFFLSLTYYLLSLVPASPPLQRFLNIAQKCVLQSKVCPIMYTVNQCSSERRGQDLTAVTESTKVTGYPWQKLFGGSLEKSHRGTGTSLNQSADIDMISSDGNMKSILRPCSIKMLIPVPNTQLQLSVMFTYLL